MTATKKTIAGGLLALAVVVCALSLAAPIAALAAPVEKKTTIDVQFREGSASGAVVAADSFSVSSTSGSGALIFNISCVEGEGYSVPMPAGYQLVAGAASNQQVVVDGSVSTLPVVFVVERVPAPEPQPAPDPDPEPTPAPAPEPTSCTVVFVADYEDGYVWRDEAATAAGGTVSLPAIPYRDGMRFSGWRIGAVGGTALSAQTPIWEDTVVYAQWIPLFYQLEFNMNGGWGHFTTQSLRMGDAPYAQENSPEREGCRFIGWSMTPDASDGIVDLATFRMPARNLTLYAHYRPVDPAAATAGAAGEPTAPEAIATADSFATSTPTNPT